MRVVILLLVVSGLLGAMGCSRRSRPNQPVTLTPEEEQRILQEVEQTSQQEEGS